MSDFMSNFEKQRSDYLEHYGVKGMRWGVINEEQPMGQYPGYGPAQPQAQGQQPYSPEDYRAAIERANEFRKIDEEQLKQRRKEIAKKVIKGVAIGAIITGLVVGGVKRFGNKQLDVGDHPNPSLGKSFGLYGAKAKEFGRDFKEGWNTNIREDTQARRDKMAEAAKKIREEKAARAVARSQHVKESFQKFGKGVATAGRGIGKGASFVGSKISSLGKDVAEGARLYKQDFDKWRTDSAERRRVAEAARQAREAAAREARLRNKHYR